MSSESENADDKDFQRMWKIASTAQFVKAFEELFKLPEIEIETLEEGLLNQSMYGIHAVKTLVVALLKVVYPTYGVSLYR
ncbi:unnamed protein product [Larinioides sclopetarius]|uniref:Uncharacterized protein n=1 Tax=Larinioides sclopetarius TaxID=280406 RepID=A0AAV2A912_9ARAC